MNDRAIIIGAGIGGLATANLLAKAGYEVHVYEQSAQPGGRAGTFSEQGYTFDTGPSWYLMPEVFDQYFALFGESASELLQLQRLDPAYKVFYDYAEHMTVTGDLARDAAMFEAIEAGGAKRLTDYVAQSDEVYQLSLRRFLYTNFERPNDFLTADVLRRAGTLGPLAFRTLHSHVKRRFDDLRLQQIMEYPMVFLGSSPFSAPAIYSLMSALDFKHGVFYPAGGLYSIIERLVRLGTGLGVRYHFGRAVTRITTAHGKATGIELAGGSRHSAATVISNADLHFTETKLLQEDARSYPARYWQSREAGPSALLMYLGVSGSLPSLQHHNLLFTKEWKANFDAIFTHKQLPAPASLYICKPSATDTAVAPAGHENLFVLVPLPSGIQLEADALERAADTYLGLIESHMQVPDLRRRITYKRLFGPGDFSGTFNAWQGTALGPAHTLRQSALFRTGNKSRKVDGLYYVGGGTIPGIGLPMCLISAQLVYKRLTGERAGGPLTTVANKVRRA